jgi:hypothetical protein
MRVLSAMHGGAVIRPTVGPRLIDKSWAISKAISTFQCLGLCRLARRVKDSRVGQADRQQAAESVVVVMGMV